MNFKVKWLPYRYWQRPWGFHRFYRGLSDIPNHPCGWQFGLYVVGLEYSGP